MLGLDLSEQTRQREASKRRRYPGMRGCWWKGRRKAVEAVWPGLALGQTVNSGDGGAAAMGVSVENHGIRTQEISARREHANRQGLFCRFCLRQFPVRYTYSYQGHLLHEINLRGW